MPTERFSDITTGSRQVSGSDRVKDMSKVYECNRCGQEESHREDIRSHVKECQPEWSNGKGLNHMEGRSPLSTRYSSRRVSDSE